MNFFEQQDQARRQTRTLIILFVLAVLAIVAAVNLAMYVIWPWASPAPAGWPLYPHGFFFYNTLITLGLIAGGTLFETFSLRDGGDAVAQMAGGRLVPPATQNAEERRLLNVVEEMAIASGIACPKVYVMDSEEAINAFAAGYHPNEAVIAVTRGTLNRLTRDELQGVIGHEFSHILNGDMRMNVRLIGVLFGIQMIAGLGQHLIDFGSRGSSSRSDNDKGPSAGAIMFALGLALMVIGYIGVFFGRWIKSAVSRQREFLADASSVQFTRNQDGIGGALRKIGGLSRSKGLGSQIKHPNAEQLSHLFLGAAKPSLVDGMFATHPPIKERLQRIYGKNVDLLDAPELDDAPEATSPATAEPGPSVSAIAFGRNAVEQIRLTPELNTAVREPASACAVVYALLLGQDDERTAQMAILKADAPQQAAYIYLLRAAIETLPPNMRLPLLDLAMPALKQLPDADKTHFLQTVDKLIAADHKITLPEFVLQTVLSRRLDAKSGRAIAVKFNSLVALKEECALLLSLLAHVVTITTHEDARTVFQRGIALCTELGLTSENLSAAATINFAGIRSALDRLNQLTPLSKPALVKALMATADNAEALPVATADVLRAICAAIEAPLPAKVAAVYE